MIHLVRALFAPALVLGIAAYAAPAAIAQDSAGGGAKAPPIELVDFAQTKAKSFEDYAGRLVLIEFFAYW